MIELVLLLGAGAVGAGLVLRWAMRPAGLVQELERIPRVQAATAPEGAQVRISGTVEVLEGTMIAPLSGTPCVLYEIVVADLVRAPQTQLDVEVTIAREVMGVPFALRDDSGRVVVDARAAEIVLEVDDRIRTEPMAPPSRELIAMLERHLDDPRHWVTKPLAIREAVVVPGDRLTIAGVGVREPDDDPRAQTSLRETPTRLRFEGAPRVPLRITDRDTPPGSSRSTSGRRG